MTQSGDTALLILTFGEVEDEAWSREVGAAKQFFRERLNSYPEGPLTGDVWAQNIGRGADWVVIAVSVASAVGTMLIAIPKAHKLVRESIDEWRRIYRELTSVYEWISAERPVLYPDAYLFLVALQRLSDSPDAEVIFHGVMRLPESNPSLKGKESLLFSFTCNGCIEQVAISRLGEVLWRNSISLRGGADMQAATEAESDPKRGSQQTG
jgi:hypothetical protein